MRGQIHPRNRYMDRLIDDSVRSNLAEHIQRIEPDLDILQTYFIVDFRYCDSLYVNLPTVRFGSDLFSFAVTGQCCANMSGLRAYSLNPT
jgi:hypothetical protein